MDKLEIYFIMPPTKITEGHPEEVPLPTKLLLPNGKEQPFIHFNPHVGGGLFLDFIRWSTFRDIEIGPTTNQME